MLLGFQNVAKAFCRQYNFNLSMADLKLLMHEAMMIERFYPCSANFRTCTKIKG